MSDALMKAAEPFPAWLDGPDKLMAAADRCVDRRFAEILRNKAGEAARIGPKTDPDKWLGVRI